VAIVATAATQDDGALVGRVRSILPAPRGSLGEEKQLPTPKSLDVMHAQQSVLDHEEARRLMEAAVDTAHEKSKAARAVRERLLARDTEAQVREQAKLDKAQADTDLETTTSRVWDNYQQVVAAINDKYHGVRKEITHLAGNAKTKAAKKDASVEKKVIFKATEAVLKDRSKLLSAYKRVDQGGAGAIKQAKAMKKAVRTAARVSKTGGKIPDMKGDFDSKRGPRFESKEAALITEAKKVKAMPSSSAKVTAKNKVYKAAQKLAKAEKKATKVSMMDAKEAKTAADAVNYAAVKAAAARTKHQKKDWARP